MVKVGTYNKLMKIKYSLTTWLVIFCAWIWFILLFVLIVDAVLADETYRVYDNKHRIVEYWKQKGDIIEVYDQDWSRKGYIRRKGNRLELYDREWERKGYVDDAPLLLDENDSD